MKWKRFSFTVFVSKNEILVYIYNKTFLFYQKIRSYKRTMPVCVCFMVLKPRVVSSHDCVCVCVPPQQVYVAIYFM